MNIITLHLSVSNAFLVEGTNGFVLFDSGLKKDEEKMLQLLSQHNVAPENISLIFHTHGHPDHIGCTPMLRSRGAGPSTIYRPDAAFMEKGEADKALHGSSLFGKLLKMIVLKPFPPVKADLVFEQEQSLAEYGLDAKFISTPGHTDGSVSVIFADGDVIAGDLISGSMMNKQKPSLPLFLRDEEQVYSSVRKILPEGKGKWYVGHGGPLDAESVKRFADRA